MDSEFFSEDLSLKLIQRLRERKRKIVFAESCTAGLLASTLGRYTGVSSVLCGSAVTYRNLTKSGWLGVDLSILEDQNIGPVSEIVARQMAWGVLQKTEEADISVSVTGFLGPESPEGDGQVFSAICQRGQEQNQIVVHEYQLPEQYPLGQEEQTLRTCRQDDLVSRIFQDLLNQLK